MKTVFATDVCFPTGPIIYLESDYIIFQTVSPVKFVQKFT